MSRGNSWQRRTLTMRSSMKQDCVALKHYSEIRALVIRTICWLRARAEITCIGRSWKPHKSQLRGYGSVQLILARALRYCTTKAQLQRQQSIAKKPSGCNPPNQDISE